MLALLLWGGYKVSPTVDASPVSATLKVTPNIGNQSMGSDFVVDFTLDTGGQSVGGVLVEVSYSSRLQFVSADATGSVFGEEVLSPTPSGGTFQFGRVRLDTGFNGSNGQLLRVTFRPTAPGTATIVINASASEVIAYFDSSNILQTTVNGSYTILGPPASCGNATCEAGETCDSCSADCGPCAVDTGGDGGGGDSAGGGGGGMTTAPPPPPPPPLPEPPPSLRCAITIFHEGEPLPHHTGKLHLNVENGEEVTFRDVPTRTWYARAVASLIRSKIASGYRDAQGHSTGLFRPGSSVTFGELAKMIVQLSGKTLTTPTSSPMNRTAIHHWSAPYVHALEQAGNSIYLSHPDVNAPTSRGAVLQAIVEEFGIPLQSTVMNPFRDLTALHPYMSAILTAGALGIVDRNTDTFRADAPIVRAELAKVLVKLAERGCQ